jgi:membrane protein implicated in regulation of membrane protease activity
MVIELIRELGAWTWLIVGVALLALEIAAPGAFFLWFGLAAIVVGVLALLVAVPWQAQIILFVVLAALIVIVGRRYFASRSGNETVTVGLNERGRRLVGTIVVLTEPIVDGKGRIRVGDTTWRVIGPNLPSGSRVRIVHAEGALLSVKSTDESF